MDAPRQDSVFFSSAGSVLARTIFLGIVQSDVSYAVHRLRPISPAIFNRHVADDALHDIWSHVLCPLPGARHQPDPELGLLQEAVPREGEASGGVHGVSEVAAGDAAANHGVLRAPVPRQVLRRGVHPGGALGEATRGCHQLQLQIFGRVGSLLCQRGFQFCFRCCNEVKI